MNIMYEFFQQFIVEKDQWKMIFVISHCEQEMLTVSTMNLINSSKFFQHWMKNLFINYLWKFILIYVDNIIVFSQTLKKYLQHFERILNILKRSNVTLNITKCHFVFFFIQTLKHHVLQLKLSTVQEKMKTIKKLFFSCILHQLKNVLEFFEYY